MDKRGLILVVDDRSSDCAYFTRVLEWADFDVVSTSDGEHAIALLTTEQFNLVIADIKMPKLSGYELYRLVQENPEIAEVPFLFITAYGPTSEVRRFGQHMSASPHLTKPVKPKDLIQAVMLYKNN